MIIRNPYGRRKKVISAAALTLMCCMLLNGCGGSSVDKNEADVQDLKKANYATAIAIHDPMAFEDTDGTFYVYGTHIVAAESEDDMLSWQMTYNEGEGPGSKMFTNLFDVADGEELPDAFKFVGLNEGGGYSVWAPSIIYNQTTKEYDMYFCTSSTYVKSALCLATSDSAAGPFEYKKTLLYSGFTDDTVDQTDFYDVMGKDADLTTYCTAKYRNDYWPNCIDPAPFYDENGRMWMVYGSWSGGIFLLELDPETGDVIHPEPDESENVDRYFGRRLLGGGHHAMEGPFIQYDSDNGYYYLFLSYGGLNRDGGYQIREFRSKEVTGPYVDMQGNTPGRKADFVNMGVKLIGNYTLPTLATGYKAPGGQSTFYDNDGRLFITYHQRFDSNSEAFQARFHQLLTTKDDWLTIAPFETQGETLSTEGYSNADLTGTFYILDHGLGIDDDVVEPQKCTLSSDGKITGGIEGTFEVEKGTDYITIKSGDVTYSGVIIEELDEAGNKTLDFSAVGDNNHTLWGVHYHK